MLLLMRTRVLYGDAANNDEDEAGDATARRELAESASHPENSSSAQPLERSLAPGEGEDAMQRSSSVARMLESQTKLHTMSTFRVSEAMQRQQYSLARESTEGSSSDAPEMSLEKIASAALETLLVAPVQEQTDTLPSILKGGGSLRSARANSVSNPLFQLSPAEANVSHLQNVLSTSQYQAGRDSVTVLEHKSRQPSDDQPNDQPGIEEGTGLQRVSRSTRQPRSDLEINSKRHLPISLSPISTEPTASDLPLPERLDASELPSPGKESLVSQAASSVAEGPTSFGSGEWEEGEEEPFACSSPMRSFQPSSILSHQEADPKGTMHAMPDGSQKLCLKKVYGALEADATAEMPQGQPAFLSASMICPATVH